MVRRDRGTARDGPRRARARRAQGPGARRAPRASSDRTSPKAFFETFAKKGWVYAVSVFPLVKKITQAGQDRTGQDRTGQDLSLKHLSESTRQADISYADLCSKNKTTKPTSLCHAPS